MARPRTRVRTCIYCRETKPTADFNREHVISGAAGSFENNLPRLRCVCTECNRYFGIALEPAFFWGTIEAYLRLYNGNKAARGVSNLTAGRLAFEINAAGPWNGVRLIAVEEDGRVVTSLVPQVGFQTVAGDRWIYVTRDELLDADAPLPAGICADLGMKLIVPSKDTEDEMVALLATRGIRFRASAPMPAPPSTGDEVFTTIRTPIDDIVRRYVTKLAVNYLAHVTGADFALRDCFDSVRAFARYGTLPPWRFFSMTDESPISDETQHVRQTRGHVLGVHWPRRSNDILAQVRLFNGPTYRLILAHGVHELWRPITRAHLFDPHSRRAHRLTSFEAASVTVRSGGVLSRVPVIQP